MRLLSTLTTNSNSRSRQTGFTLVEILIALALITLLAVGITLSFDGSRSRAQALLSNMSELAAANVRLKNDMGCYVSAPSGLLTPAAAVSNNYCNLASSTTWNGPYVGVFTSDAAGAATLDKVAAGVTVTFFKPAATAANNPYGSNGINYEVIASGVPADVVKQALQECNGAPTEGTGFNQVKCDGDSTSQTFMVLFDTTR
jgi:prepilin-type N-terminal cleavage/methylation domain-containing protein